MAGKLVPLVVWPRFTAFAGRHVYTTLPVDVSEFSRAILTCWRGPMGPDSDPASVSIGFTCQESIDQVNWSICAGTNASNYDPGEDAEGVVLATLTKRWFRVRASFTASATVQDEIRMTCWSVGHLERREP
jgi:hypothetical protein